MRKCRSCICHTCIKACGCQNCTGYLKNCGKYQRFEQLRLFIPRSRSKQTARAPRASWKDYQISRERYLELRNAVRSGKYDDMARTAANIANKSIAEYILLSVKEKRSYEGVEYAEGLGRIPCGRTDFYGYRRLFYHLLDQELKRDIAI